MDLLVCSGTEKRRQGRYGPDQGAVQMYRRLHYYRIIYKHEPLCLSVRLSILSSVRPSFQLRRR